MSINEQATASSRGMEAGAAYAKALMSGQPLPGASTQQSPIADASAAEVQGAEAARAVIAVAGQPEVPRQDAPGAGGSADAAAGAAEARRLLGKA